MVAIRMEMAEATKHFLKLRDIGFDRDQSYCSNSDNWRRTKLDERYEIWESKGARR